MPTTETNDNKKLQWKEHTNKPHENDDNICDVFFSSAASIHTTEVKIGHDSSRKIKERKKGGKEKPWGGPQKTV